MAEPLELPEPTPQIDVDSLEYTGWIVPAGWYGFAPASGPGIIDRAKVGQEEGRAALRLLGAPEANSRSQDFEGRRLVRIDGGYLVLNYMKYRERDYTSAERSRRYRERKAQRHAVALTSHAVISRKQKQSTEVEEEKNVRTRATKDDVTDRVRRFVARFQDLHEQYCGVAYLGNPQKDYQAACELVASFDDAWLHDIAVAGFEDTDAFMANGTRTITKLKSRASKYASQLAMQTRQSAPGSTQVAESEDWYSQCQRLHGGACGLSSSQHRTRLAIDAAKETW